MKQSIDNMPAKEFFCILGKVLFLWHGIQKAKKARFTAGEPGFCYLLCGRFASVFFH